MDASPAISVSFLYIMSWNCNGCFKAIYNSTRCKQRFFLYIYATWLDISVCMFDLLPNCSISTMIIDSNLFLDLFYSPCMK